MSRAQFLTEYKIIVLGGGGVGKSAFTIQFIQYRFFEDYDPTIEEPYVRLAVVDDEVALLYVLDTAGQEEYRVVREYQMRDADGFLILYSTTSRSSFKDVQELQQQILRVTDRPSCPVVIVANKTDLTSERQVSTKEGRDLALSLDCLFVEASAKTRLNVEEAFCSLVREIRRHNKEHKLKQPVVVAQEPERKGRTRGPVVDMWEPDKIDMCRCVVT